MQKRQISSPKQCSQVISQRGNLRKRKLRGHRSKSNECQFNNKKGDPSGRPYIYHTNSKFGLSSGLRPTFAMSIHSPCTFTRTTSPVKSVTVPPLLLNNHEPTA